MHVIRIIGIGLMLLGGMKTPYAQEINTSLKSELPLFTPMHPEYTGVDFTNTLEEDAYRNVILYQYYYNGGGVALGDVNQDGWVDIFFTGNTVSNRLYLNKGDWKFEDVSTKTGIIPSKSPSWCTGVVMTDINADGLLDIYVCRSGKLQPENRRNLLYVHQGNDEDGTPQYVEAAAEYGIDDAGYSIHAAFWDYDRDNDLDLFLLNHGMAFFEEQHADQLRNARDPYKGDKLYENRGGRFIDVSEVAGIKGSAFGYGLGVGIGDLNQDGWDDIYVSNDFFEHDYLYWNKGDGTFEEGIKKATRHISNYSMGNDVADVNNDGRLDITVVDMVAENNRRLKANMSGMNPEDFWFFVNKGYHYQYMFNTLHLNNGNETFSDVAQLTGMAQTDWSWAPIWADFDLDRRKDLYVTNGIRKEARNTDFRNLLQSKLESVAQNPQKENLTVSEWRDILDQMPSEKISNYLFLNQGELYLMDATKHSGLAIPSFSNGAAYGDLDNDGDADLVVNNMDDTAFVFQNHATQTGNHYLKVQFEGPEANPLGLGAWVELSAGGEGQVYQHYMSRGYQSSMAPGLLIGLGTASTIDSLVVKWPDGNIQHLIGIDGDQTLILSYQQASSATEEKSIGTSVFQKISDTKEIQFEHMENEFDDFEREVLLPHKLSQLGPGMAKGDVNGDGWEDVYIGGARGQAGRLFCQTGDGVWKVGSSQPWEADRYHEDMDAAFFDADMDGDLDLYVVSGGNEETTSFTYYQDRLYLNEGEGTFARYEGLLPTITHSGSCVLPADVDGDGDQDLFIGGRLIPGEYPVPGNSYLLINDGGIFDDKTEKLAPGLADIGMVTDGVWIDYDKDKDWDLMVVGEWMAITLFKNEGGTLIQESSNYIHLTKEPAAQTGEKTSTVGWWFDIASDDWDRDGDQDVVVGNVGLNYKYKASQQAPFEIYSDDFDDNGQRDIVLAYHQDDELYPLRGRSCSAQQMPLIKNKYPTYDAFAEADLVEVYGDLGINDALHYKATLFASVYLENQGDGTFELIELPRMAQLSSINGFISRDFTGDGNRDLLLAGNLYTSEIETVRNDAGNGLLLKGKGNGEFIPMSVLSSGFFVPNDVKDMLLIDTPGGQEIWVINNDGPLQRFELRNDEIE